MSTTKHHAVCLVVPYKTAVISIPQRSTSSKHLVVRWLSYTGPETDERYENKDCALKAVPAPDSLLVHKKVLIGLSLTGSAKY